MRMKVTFLTPPSLDKFKPAERTAGCTRVVYNMVNIYELTVAALLENAGFDVRYRNFVLDNASPSDCFSFLENDDSEVYFFWTVNLSIPTDKKVEAFIHRQHPQAWCVFLGPGATYFTSVVLDHSRSIVVRGEPEDTVSELMPLLRDRLDWKGIRGISYLDGHVVSNPPRPLIRDLDALPFPAIHFVSKYEFFNPKLKVTPYMAMVTSRNCPFHCIYCVPSSLTFAREIEYKKEHSGKKPPVGFRSTDSVVEEIHTLARQGFKAIGFMDDNFIVTEKRLRIIGAALKERKDPGLLAVVLMAEGQKLQGKYKRMVQQARPLTGKVMDFLGVDKQDRTCAGKENMAVNDHADTAAQDAEDFHLLVPVGGHIEGAVLIVCAILFKRK